MKKVYSNPNRVYVHPKIQGGRDFNREKARIRDNHTCQDCGKQWKEGQRRFDTHHIKGLCGKKSHGYDNITEINLLVTLCHSCHYNRPEHRCKNEGWNINRKRTVPSHLCPKCEMRIDSVYHKKHPCNLTNRVKQRQTITVNN